VLDDEHRFNETDPAKINTGSSLANQLH
jgi:hypothetical protein